MKPLPQHRNGLITGYLVRVTQASNGIRQEVSSTDDTVTITSLTLYTQYFVNVAAKTVNGTGPLSESYEVTTLEAGKSEGEGEGEGEGERGGGGLLVLISMEGIKTTK